MPHTSARRPTPLLRRALSAAVVAAASLGLAATVAPVASAAPNAWELLRGGIASGGGAPVVYHFGPDAPIPKLAQDGRGSELEADADLLVVPHASTAPLATRLLTDLKRGDQARCENAGVRAGDTAQAAELYAPVDAWLRMGRPAVAINANFFDIRGQNGTSWSESMCSSPMGVYYDSHVDNRTIDLTGWDGRHYVGPAGLTNGVSPWAPLSTFAVADGTLLNDPRPNTFHEVDAAGPFDNPAGVDLVNGLEYDLRQFVALGGLKLRGGPDWTVGDDPHVRTHRSAIGYNPVADEFYIFAGRSMSQHDVQEMFRSVGADIAIGLDGGGSSALVVDKAAVRWAGQTGGAAPAGTCENVPGLYCTSTANRPVPGWFSVRFAHIATAVPPALPPVLVGGRVVNP